MTAMQLRAVTAARSDATGTGLRSSVQNFSGILLSCVSNLMRLDDVMVYVRSAYTEHDA